jgi:UDP-N-acetylglucosamine--N-acetylmuramyl-(pentapeptide) pyrophosphoryl-undecaprenol N-acetylglucosamine transferase
VYPALAVLQALNDLNPEWQEEGGLLWVGGEGGMEGEIISRQDLEFRTIPAAGLHGVGLKSLPGNLSQLIRGYYKARSLMREFQPDVLFFTGGYLAVPAAIAGKSVPSLVFVPDIEPGLALRTISRLAEKIAFSVERGRQYAPKGKPVLISGYPVRSRLLEWTREAAIQALELRSEMPVLLVFGGSKGARSINKALWSVLPELLDEVQIVHISGNLDWKDAAARRDDLTKAQQDNYRVYPFLHERMGAALRSADLVVSRSGASVLGEYPLFELPAILVPYPHAWQYQKTNAAYLVEKGAALIINDEELTEKLLPTVRSLINDRDMLERMREEMDSLAKPDAAKTIARELVVLAGNKMGGSRL